MCSMDKVKSNASTNRGYIFTNISMALCLLRSLSLSNIEKLIDGL